MFKNTLDNKRYYTLNYYLRNKFHKKVFKVPLDAGFGCPNNSMCIYCSNQSKSNIINSKSSILEQFYNNVKILEKKWPDSLYIAYFQTGTNTNCKVEDLSLLIEELLKIDKVVGISISTRPDSISEDMYNYLEDLNKRTFLTIELGLQTSNNNTLKLIKRGHTKEDFTYAVNRLHNMNIFVVAHIINGLPQESEVDMLNTIEYLNNLGIEGIKIHMLFIEKNTEIANMYLNNEFHLLTKEEYIDITIKQLERLNSNVVIERITGDPVKENLIEPSWLLKKFVVLNDIDKEMFKRNTYQGKEKER
jgi:uncharacterized protein